MQIDKQNIDSYFYTTPIGNVRECHRIDCAQREEKKSHFSIFAVNSVKFISHCQLQFLLHFETIHHKNLLGIPPLRHRNE